MEKSKRREFLKKSILGISGATLIPQSMRSALLPDPQQNEIADLPKRILGRTGIKTPIISMGAGNANNSDFVRAAYFAGVKLFFSATYYGEGNNERLVGAGLKGLPRDTFIVGTAATPDNFDTRSGDFTAPFNINSYIKKVGACLERFGLDYVDILLFPYAGKRDVILNESLLKALQTLKKQEKIKLAGIATHSNNVEALRAVADSKFYDVAMTAYNYKAENKDELNEAINYAAKAGIGIVAMKTLAGVSRDKSRNNPLNTDAALKWVLQNENISSVVSGMSSLEELKKNIEMIRNLKLSEQELNDLNLAGLKKEPSLYCHQCRACIPQCPYNLEIPTVMRAYMYAYGYRNMEHAQHTLIQAALPGNPCENCELCKVDCTAGFNIKDKIEDIYRIKDVPQEFLKA